jgi:hypothetical protein
VPLSRTARSKRGIRKYCRSVARSWKMGTTDCAETSVCTYRCTLCKPPEEGRSHLHRGASFKSRISTANSDF